MPKGTCKLLPLSEKVKVINLSKKKKKNAEVANIYDKNDSSILYTTY